ncbi:ribosomal protein S18-alanine N-acetyltransferase [Neisseria leonii]|uniref:[Ribosomal protein bS18]-alanine N-acetyltransferase n=1 Tax=Neisseria leonii TaxID=2995413 RepID=A0A9X4IEA3_9NEIS|nr:ribosomal protein S18-alanine N-acetyltransferase [Neisseria sp. 51.81]MDD9328541.1 ribosomal protein S18-alanine N-acetyltransferase [Neisseria sp. 51.81]
MLIRAALPADCAALADLDAQCNPSPWHETQFAAALGNIHNQTILAESDGLLLGFAVWQTVCGESELHLIAVSPKHRRQGIAAGLMANWLAQTAGAAKHFLEVRHSNEAAIALYRRFGFDECGRRKNYYPLPDGTREDAILMEQIC